MKKNKGYTLVEILVAFAIFAILIIPVSGMINTSIKGNKSSRQKLELANIYNYAYESYLNSPKQEEIYMGYKIKYEDVNKTQYELSGIDYNDYDILLKLNGNVIEAKWNIREQSMNESIWNSQLESGQLINGRDKVNNIRIEIFKNQTENKYRYKISLTKVVTSNDGTENKITETQENEVNNPTGNILFDINNNSTYKINLLVDGVYDSNRIMERVITVNSINKTNDNNIKIASVYPNVEFISKERIEFDKNQNVEYIKISIFKDNNKLDEKVYEFSKILK